MNLAHCASLVRRVRIGAMPCPASAACGWRPAYTRDDLTWDRNPLFTAAVAQQPIAAALQSLAIPSARHVASTCIAAARDLLSRLGKPSLPLQNARLQRLPLHRSPAHPSAAGGVRRARVQRRNRPGASPHTLQTSSPAATQLSALSLTSSPPPPHRRLYISDPRPPPPSQAIDAAKEPKLAAIRLAWWRDTLSRALATDGGKAPPHPVAKALRAARAPADVMYPLTHPQTRPRARRLRALSPRQGLSAADCRRQTAGGGVARAGGHGTDAPGPGHHIADSGRRDGGPPAEHRGDGGVCSGARRTPSVGVWSLFSALSVSSVLESAPLRSTHPHGARCGVRQASNGSVLGASRRCADAHRTWVCS